MLDFLIQKAEIIFIQLYKLPNTF